MRISFKDYAAQKNISYEAVRSQVKRYEKVLQGHIFKEGRTQFLDDFAVTFLDDKRLKHPVIVMEANKDAELEQLRADVESLRAQLFEKQNKIEKLQDDLLEAERENKQLALDKQELQHLLEAPKEPEKTEKKGILGWLFG